MLALVKVLGFGLSLVLALLGSAPPIPTYSCPFPTVTASAVILWPSAENALSCVSRILIFTSHAPQGFENHIFPLYRGLYLVFRKRRALGPVRFPVQGERALRLGLFTGKPHAAAGLLN